MQELFCNFETDVVKMLFDSVFAVCVVVEVFIASGISLHVNFEGFAAGVCLLSL